MKLDYPFIQLPLTFDADRLLKEVSAIDGSAWQPHPQGYAGNFAMTLVTPDGINNNDEMSGPMMPTDYLKSCPYLMEVMRCIGGVWGRTRLMKLSGQAEVTPHIDTNYYWRERMRVHVPIVTQPSVRFYCGEQDMHMPAGECWIFDTWSMHNVVNDASEERIHLVADTVGGEAFWQWFRAGRPLGMDIPGWQAQHIPVFHQSPPPLRLETQNLPDVMTPWEMREHFNFLFSEAAPHPDLNALTAITYDLTLSWQALWMECGSDVAAYPRYARLRDDYMQALRQFQHLQLRSGYPLVRSISQSLMLHCLKDAKRTFKEHRETGKAPLAAKPVDAGRIERPVILVSAPRSGSTMFFEALEKSPELCSIGGESHGLMESIPMLHPGSRNYDSNVLAAKHCSGEIARELHARFHQSAHKPDGSKPAAGEPMRLLEKTPKNALRIPFMKQLFPDAQFVYLYRDPKPVIASMIDAWQSGKFITYPDLPGWPGLPWSLLLTPGWRALAGKPLHHIVAQQWLAATKIMLDDLEALDPASVLKVRYESLLSGPQAELERVCTFCGIVPLPGSPSLPLSKHTLTLPDPDKWKRHAVLIEEIWPIIAAQAERAERFIADMP
jgi:hypothetical protein